MGNPSASELDAPRVAGIINPRDRDVGREPDVEVDVFSSTMAAATGKSTECCPGANVPRSVTPSATASAPWSLIDACALNAVNPGGNAIRTSSGCHALRPRL